MTRKQRRATLILAAMGVLSLALGLIVFALTQKGAFDRFYLPSDAAQRIAESKLAPGARFRLGGLVEKGSLKRDGERATFNITDTSRVFRVSYTGVLPDLFREEQGVIVTGTLQDQTSFLAETVLAKHDETYMPPEVAKALKDKGVWQHAKPPAK